MSAEMLTIGDVCRIIGERRGVDIPPQKLSDLFYRRKLDARRCPIVGGSRRVPADYVAAIEVVMEVRGIVPERSTGKAVPR